MASTSSHFLPALDNAPGAPAFLLQVTHLGPASSLLWVGTSSAHQPRPSAGRQLAGEWVCGMPSSSKDRPAVGTTLYRASSPAGLALPISLRLARKLNRQILLSFALPPSLTAPSQALGADANQGRILVDLEGKILRVLRAQDGPPAPAPAAGGRAVDAVAGELAQVGLAQAEGQRLVGR